MIQARRGAMGEMTGGMGEGGPDPRLYFSYFGKLP